MFSAVRGKKGMLHRLSHLSLILWKNASSSLSLLKWKNFALSGVFMIDLFSLTFDWSASSGSTWPPVDVSSSGFMCWTGLEVWNGSLSQWTGNLLAGACVDWIRGLLNHTFFLNRMGILWGSCGIKNWLKYNQNNSHIAFCIARHKKNDFLLSVEFLVEGLWLLSKRETKLWMNNVKP